MLCIMSIQPNIKVVGFIGYKNITINIIFQGKMQDMESAHLYGTSFFGQGINTQRGNDINVILFALQLVN